jgi:lipopolysaccharide/colanic/teichoic acid biosynthesis glycosyltransferase
MTAMSALFDGALPMFSPRTAVLTQGRHEHARAHGRDHQRSGPHVIDEPLFRSALIKERKRADRFDQPFMLLVVAKSDAASDSSSTWVPVIEALRSIKGDTDVLGWFDKGSALGMILPEIGATDEAVRHTLHDRVRRELARRLDSETATSGFSIRLHVHLGARPPGPAPADSLPLDLHGRTDRITVRDAFKRGLDTIGSLALLASLLPAYLAIAALVKLTSSGPVFFRQERIGQMGRSFRMLKFRTMHVNADHAIHQQYVTQFINAGNPVRESGTNEVFKIVNDPRVTPIGRVLRKTSLDELPQFWNVLQGDMSLVGPRPPLPYEVEQYKPWHYRRVLEAKPGITGLWQVTGRSRTSFDDMVRLDLRYARTHSVWTDMKILLATPRAVISGKGAC